MSSTALLPIVIPPIVYAKNFTCAGEGLRYADQARESPETLRDLIAPRGGRQPIGDRERPKVWWRAQCLFYDLPAPASSTIAQLRTALENALRTKTLALKTGLADDEHRLNNEFRELNAQVRDRTGVVAQKKEKAASPSKGRSKTGVEATTKARASRTAATAPADSMAQKTLPAAKSSPSKAKAKAKQPAVPSSTTEVSILPDEKATVRPRQTAKRGGAVAVGLGRGTSLPVSRGPGRMPSHDSELMPGLMHVGGRWEIECEEIAAEWGHIDPSYFTLEIHQSKSDGSFLASFDLGIVTGVFRPLPQSLSAIMSPSLSSSNPPLASSYIRFEWCGRETGEDQIQLPSQYRRGWVRFESDRTDNEQWGGKRVAETLKGGIDFAGTWKFEARRIDYANRLNLGESWEDYNEDEYEREKVQRWH